MLWMEAHLGRTKATLLHTLVQAMQAHGAEVLPHMVLRLMATRDQLAGENEARYNDDDT